MIDTEFKELPVISSGPMVHGPSNKDPIIGIDLGTTNSLVAIFERGLDSSNGVKIIPSHLDGKNLIPSVVRLTQNGELEVGGNAKMARLNNERNVIYSVKRLLGRGLDDLHKQKFSLPFNLEGSSESNVKIKLGERYFTPIEISALILKELKASAEQYLGRKQEDA